MFYYILAYRIIFCILFPTSDSYYCHYVPDVEMMYRIRARIYPAVEKVNMTAPVTQSVSQMAKKIIVIGSGAAGMSADAAC